MRLTDRSFRAVLDGSPDGMLIECREAVAYVNPVYARLLGYPSSTELEKASIRDIAHPEDQERLCWFGRQRLDGKPAPNRYTFRACARGGGIVTLDATVSLTRIDGELLITTSVRELRDERDDDVSLSLPGEKTLSPRETEVLKHVLAGRRSKEIAVLMGVSEKTVGTHRSRLFQKLALRGDRDLFRLAAERGLIAGQLR